MGRSRSDLIPSADRLLVEAAASAVDSTPQLPAVCVDGSRELLKKTQLLVGE